MASNARNLSKLLGTSTQVPTTALPPAIADLETVGQTLSGGEITPSSIKSNTLTQSFDSNQAVEFNMADSIDAVSPIVSVFKEVPVTGVSSKGKWDVNANATNYEFFDEKPISYSSANLTPSATGDGTFTNSAAVTSGYDLSNISYDNKSFDVSTQETKPTGLHFKPDGSKMYVSGYGTDAAYQYSLSTPYDVSTASYDSKSLSGLSQDTTNGRGLDFKPDGTKLYFIGSTNDRVYEYSLSTAWDISTGSYNNVFFGVGSQANNPTGVRFKSDGTKMYVSQYQGNSVGNYVHQYTLSTAWDITSASYDNVYLDVNTQPVAVEDFAFSSDGTSLVVCDAAGVLRKYTLSTGWDISTASLITTTASLTQLSNGSGAVAFNTDGTKTYVASRESDTVCQYSTSESLAFNAADVGKKVVGNSGSAIITSAAGAYTSVTAFADTSAISSWQLFGAQGKSNGSGIELSGAAQVGTPLNAGTYNSTSTGITYTGYYSLYSNGGSQFGESHFGPDGTKFYSWTSSTNVRIWSPTTAFDISTLGNSVTNVSGFTANGGQCIRFSKTGDKAFHLGSNGYSLHSYDLSTPFDLSTKGSVTTKTMSFQGTGSVDTMGWYQGNVTVGSGGHHMGNFVISPDGSYFVGECRTNNGCLVRGVMSTPYDISTLVLNQSLARGVSIPSPGTQTARNRSGASPAWNQGGGIWFSDDGKLALWWGSAAVVEGFQYRFSTGWDFSTASGVYDGTTNNMGWSPPAPSGNSSRDVGTKALEIGTKPDGQVIMQVTLFWNNSALSPEQSVIASYNLSADPNSSSIYPYSQYSPALTNSSTGQINSSSWLDINSMTADETKNGGDVFYAVSTDNRSSWGVAKASDGVRKIVKNNSGTWQYNNDGGGVVGYGLANETYDNKNLDTTANTSEEAETGIAVSSDGTKFYITGYQQDKVFQFDLSTPFDLSTGVYNNVSYTLTGLTHPWGLFFKSDGTKMYVLNAQSTTTISEYALSTAWDVSTASHTTTENYPAGPTYESNGLFFKSDGSKVYILRYNSTVYSWNLTTPWDITTGSYIGVTSAFLNSNSGRQILFNGDGLKMYLLLYDGSPNTYYIREYDLSTAWDPSTASYNNISFQPGLDLGGSSATITAMCWANSGKKLYVTKSKSSGGSNYGANSFTTTTTGFGTSETWVNGTNNNEHATLQQALTSQAFNRMDKAQLDAVADGYHFSQDSADTLDLMIAPYAASGTSPISDGVTINYDAEALIREAIPGTDYIAEFPNPTTLNITAVSAANLKIRAQ